MHFLGAFAIEFVNDKKTDSFMYIYLPILSILTYRNRQVKYWSAKYNLVTTNTINTIRMTDKDS